MRYAIITKPDLHPEIANRVVNIIEWDGCTPYDPGDECILAPAGNLVIDQNITE